MKHFIVGKAAVVVPCFPFMPLIERAHHDNLLMFIIKNHVRPLHNGEVDISVSRNPQRFAGNPTPTVNLNSLYHLAHNEQRQGRKRIAVYDAASRATQRRMALHNYAGTPVAGCVVQRCLIDCRGTRDIPSTEECDRLQIIPLSSPQCARATFWPLRYRESYSIKSCACAQS